MVPVPTCQISALIQELFSKIQEVQKNLDASKADNQTLESKVQELQKKLSTGKQRSPEDTQLEIDAYRLADEIEAWWSMPDGVLIKTERNQLSETQWSDYGHFIHPPEHWKRGAPNRESEWEAMIKREFKIRFQPRVVVLEEHFKERGIPNVGYTGIENVTGPLGIRATIDYLRKSAAELEIKRRTPKQ